MSMFAALHFPWYAYGILMLASFLIGIWLFAANCRATATKMPDLVDLMLVLSIPGLAGARLLYILLYPQQFRSFRDYLALHEGGLVFYGGLFGSLAALIIYLRRQKISWRPALDCLVPSLAIGHAIGRLGCIINNCCYGAQTDVIRIYRLHDDPPGCFRHPTQIYEAAFLVVIAIITSLVLRSKKTQKVLQQGVLTGLYLAAYSLWRFLIEFVRGDDRGGFFTSLHLSPSQLAAIILMVMACLLIVYCHKHPVGTGDKAK